jgi:hypothetical protein
VSLTLKQVLIQSKDAEFKPELRAILQSTRAVIFLGTPHRGSDWAGFAAKITILAAGKRDEKVLQTLKVDSEVLERLMDQFAVLLKKDAFKVHSFIEGQSVTDISGFNDKVCTVLETSSFGTDGSADCTGLLQHHWRCSGEPPNFECQPFVDGQVRWRRGPKLHSCFPSHSQIRSKHCKSPTGLVIGPYITLHSTMQIP